MDKILLIPPITFLFVLILMGLELMGLKIFSKGLLEKKSGGACKSYACGEDVDSSKVQPNYRQFFHFAFFFTIMHVVAMIVSTVPASSMKAVIIAVFYIVASATGLFILFRR